MYPHINLYKQHIPPQNTRQGLIKLAITCLNRDIKQWQRGYIIHIGRRLIKVFHLEVTTHSQQHVSPCNITGTFVNLICSCKWPVRLSVTFRGQNKRTKEREKVRKKDRKRKGNGGGVMGGSNSIPQRVLTQIIPLKSYLFSGRPGVVLINAAYSLSLDAHYSSKKHTLLEVTIKMAWRLFQDWIPPLYLFFIK